MITGLTPYIIISVAVTAVLADVLRNMAEDHCCNWQYRIKYRKKFQIKYGRSK